MYYGADDPVQGAVQAHQENGNPPTYTRTDPHSPCLTRASSPTNSLSSTNTIINPPPQLADEPIPSLDILGQPLPFPQESDIVRTLLQLNEEGEGLTNEVLLEWALDVLCSLEDWKWLWNPEPATTHCYP